MPHKVIIVDDHQLVASGLSKIFEEISGFQLIGTYDSSVEALKKICLLEPDLVITDLDMPQMNGFELIERCKQQSQVNKFILLTMHLDRNTIKKAMALKIQGYILKDSDTEEFVHCIKTVMNSLTYFTPKAMEALMDRAINIELKGYKKLDLLTTRELEILKLVVAGFSTKEISEQLFISVRTTETHRKAIMEKFEVNNIAGMVRTAMQEGLID